MQPSEYEIQREVEALRDIRRRSTADGLTSFILDPDLPSSPTASSSTSPTYWPSPDDSSGSSHEEGSENSPINANDDPSHLFWVPARLHPEIAPAEFRQFLKEHARNPADETSALARSVSSGSIGLDRKKSLLSRQYKPAPNDGIEDEQVVPIRRNRSVYSRPGPQLTINDLQKLEELAEEASKSDDPTRLRSVLRRSLSLNVSPSVIDQMDDMPDLGDDVDSPIVIPRPNQALRRSARTKIRKPGTGEGAHRFTATRRKKSVSRAATMQELRTSSSDLSSSDHGHADTSRRPHVEESIPAVPPLPRPESFSEEALIYDAYVTDEPDELDLSLRTESPEPSVDSHVSPPPSTTSHSEAHEPLSEPEPVLHHPQPQRAVAPPVSEPPVSARSPSPPQPSSSSPSPAPSINVSHRPPSEEAPTRHSRSSSISEQRKDKDKKGGLFGKWGSDKSNKKTKESREREKEKEKEKEKDTGFFGSLFGGKKKQDDTPAPLGMGASGRETAAALLGASKSSKSYVPSPSPQLAGMYARYPIHVERAIYRLSHIKLANPRRPLYEQVLISNLMFWYLGVINKTQNTAGPQGNSAAQPQPQSQPTPIPDQEQLEREQREREERERAERERMEKEQEQREKQRRGSLTKQSTSGTPPGTRRAEMPVRGPQYEMQHRAMEQEYGYMPPSNGAGGATLGRTSSIPTSANNSLPYQSSPPPRSSSAPPAQFSVQLVHPQPQLANGNIHNAAMQSQHYPPATGAQLPPGAMSPVAVEQTWLATTSVAPLAPRGSSSTSPPPRASSPPNSMPVSTSSSRQARSPPPNRYTPAQEKQPFSGGRSPSRSLSASAAPPMMQQTNGKLKKGISAHAVVQNRRRSNEEEDVPLAVYQQQYRRR
ncbi:uncharacterized protein FIBRA_02779 [Fibroporia radiculosa]|uniref:Protein Zds1 C-terminal domain-containing protein n=1 Tax=Fibroporia radiculosa TaxID=599839 RepID=J4H216_9APHY|nr:uncharacterized protein FIBRA_02779 [Fibroporia radiculosa]CCM00739.1 predicted protein [Fibroporia radiculosa]